LLNYLSVNWGAVQPELDRTAHKRIINLEIPDIDNYMDPKLKELIKERMKDWWTIIKEP